jgi:hypothetical protein
MTPGRPALDAMTATREDGQPPVVPLPERDPAPGGVGDHVSDWTWEYVPDAASVVGGLTSEQVAEVEALAVRAAIDGEMQLVPMTAAYAAEIATWRHPPPMAATT